MRWNTAGYIVSVRGDDGHERDVFCRVHFHPFLPYVRWVEIPEEGALEPGRVEVIET
jgi:hypothetical protein